MFLKLNNVRQHVSLEVTLPDTGLHMIQGRSGAGKTTVLDAIHDALYGGVSDLAPWGTTKSRNEFQINSPKFLKIIRTRGPATLTVIDEAGTEHKDDAAQALIDATIGMSEHEFLACCYIQQGMFGSLLSLTPAEQLKFIQRLGSTRVMPEEIKAKTLTMIAKTDVELGIESTNLDNAVASFTLLVSEIAREQAELVAPEMPNIGISEADALNLRVKIGNKKTETYTHIAEIQAVLKNPMYDEIRTYDSQKAQYDIFQSEMTEKINAFIAQKEGLIKGLAAANPSQLDEEIGIINKKLEYISIYKKILNLRERIVARFGDFVNKPSVFLAKYIATAQETKTTVNEALMKARVELLGVEGQGIPQPCPECGTALYVAKGKLSKDQFCHVDVDALKANISNLCNLASQVDTDLRDSQAVLEVGKDLMAQLERVGTTYTVDIATEQDLLAHKGLITQAITDYHKETSRLESVISNINNYVTMIADKAAVIIRKGEAIKTFTTWPGYKTATVLETDLQNLIDQSNQLGRDLSVVEMQLAEWRDYNRKVQHHETIQKYIGKNIAKADELEAQIKVITETCSKKRTKIGALHKLKELCDFAAVSATEIVIDHINASAQEYLDKLFADDGTMIKIKNHKITKAGDERAKLSLDIVHKGKIAKGISSLSGGEKSRACLAFQLALSDLYKSKILLIDEGFSGLSEVDKSVCMEILQQVSIDKLVIVIEHGSSEAIFDEIVRL